MIGGSGAGVGGTQFHCSLSDFGPQEWRVGSPSQEALSKPEAALNYKVDGTNSAEQDETVSWSTNGQITHS